MEGSRSDLRYASASTQDLSEVYIQVRDAYKHSWWFEVWLREFECFDITSYLRDSQIL